MRLWDRFAETEDGWELTESEFRPEHSAQMESVFAVANGYLGVRGTPEEGVPAHETGAALNGFYESWPIEYPEDAYGLARIGQTIVQAPDPSVIRLFVDGVQFDLAGPDLLRFKRTLDMRRGVLTREVELATPRGHRLLVRSRRLASLDHRHLVALHYEVVALDGPAEIALSSELAIEHAEVVSDDPRRAKGFVERPLVPQRASASELRAVLQLETRNSGLALASGMDHEIDSDAETVTEASAGGDHATVHVLADLEPGQSLRVSKFAAYHWAGAEERGRLAQRVHRSLDRARRHGYPAVEDAHARHVERFWDRSDVEVEGAPEVQLAIRFNLFQLMQATARGEGLGVPAKGVTGRGYEGHYFWDTEIYVVPFLAHTSPEWAKHVLEFRVGMLDAARRRASEIGHRGALFPWRTISGDEASAFYASGTAQYHINADVTYAMHQYNRVTGDLGFMLEQGAEVVVETARFWMELGFFDERRGGRFSIMGVTGPDEYTTVVDNNAYTNLMAKENLEIATRVVEWLQGADRAAWAALALETGLTDDEVDGWRRAAERMYVPRHEELGIVLQDERFLERKRWDFENTPEEHYPLLLNYHPLEIYRHQVIKQTDVVLATYLVGHHFSDEEKRRTFDYYDPLTTGDSSLSASVQSVIASEVGYADAALAYFHDAVAVDLLDLHGNTADGIHIASAGGAWLALVAGFAGLRDSDGEVHFDPELPEGWERLRFRVQVRGQTIEVDMTPEGTAYRLVEGRGLIVYERGERDPPDSGALGRRRLTCDHLVTYPPRRGRGVQGPGGSHPAQPARRAVRRRRADADGARGPAPDVALRRDEAPEGARGGEPRGDEAARPREAPLPEPRPDPAHPRQVGEQIRRALDASADGAQARTGGLTMEKVFEIYIKTTPERLWEAITNSELRRKYSFGIGSESDWSEGSSYVSSDATGEVRIAKGENLEVDPPRRLVQTMTALWSDDVESEGVSRVTWEIEQVEDSCRLTVTHDQLREGANNELYGGWPMILSGLKTLLETGETLTTPGSLLYANAT